MSQVQKGLLLGAPGPVGSAAIGIFYGSGSPLTNTDPNLSGARTGSLYTDYVGGNLWFKTTSGWQQVTIP
jgi:hypothetical protein